MTKHIPCSLNLHIAIDTSSEGVRGAELTLKPAGGLTWEFTQPQNHQWDKQVEAWLSAYAKGEKLPKLPMDLFGHTLFTQQVWAVLQAIPKGRTLSYGEVAAKLGKPQASRAVGGACGRNPMLLFIPCHRVLQSNGSLGGFSCGLPLKKALLTYEGVSLA